MLKVTPEVLKKSAQELGTISAEMKKITDRMNTLVEELKASWQDENGKVFTERFEEEVATKFSNYYNLVNRYSSFIQGAHDKYSMSIANIKESVSYR